MDFDFKPFFQKYKALAIAADSVFERMKKEYPDLVKCRTGCADCCHALFDLSLIEALYLNHCFGEKFTGPEREQLLERANRADRQVYKLKRKAYQELKRGRPEPEILEDLANKRARCALLNKEDRCDLYEHRPITCRFYGIPTSIAGQGHTCGLTGFKKGESYPTVNLDAIHQRLFEISAELIAALKSRHVKMAEMLVPVSMALLTCYDETYLGLPGAKDPKAEGEDHD
jgi:Fe-S-cluster containining protein